MQPTWYLPVTEAQWSALANLGEEARIELLLADRSLEMTIGRGLNGPHRPSIEGEFSASTPVTLSHNSYTHLIQLTDQMGGRVGTVAPILSLGADSALWKCFSGCAQRIYRFDTNRIPPAGSQSAASGHLASNASNLAACINYLSTTQAPRHKLFCEWVNRVLPHVRWVQAPHVDNSQVRIECLQD